MIIILHVTIAMLGIILTTVGYLRPTNTNLRISYALTALTFVSGFYLVWNEPAQMLHACMSGITYLAIVTVGILATRRKLAMAENEQA